MSPVGHVFGSCSFILGLGSVTHALAAGLTLIKLLQPFPEHGFSYLKWQLQRLCESFGAGLGHSTSPGGRCPRGSMGLSIVDHLCTQELIIPLKSV